MRVVAVRARADTVGLGDRVAVGVVGQVDVQSGGGVVACIQRFAFVVRQLGAADQRSVTVFDLFQRAIADGIELIDRIRDGDVRQLVAVVVGVHRLTCAC